MKEKAKKPSAHNMNNNKPTATDTLPTTEKNNNVYLSLFNICKIFVSYLCMV